MTIEEIRDLYGGYDGYVRCRDCPVYDGKGACHDPASGYDDCYEKILEYLGENDVVNHPSHYTQGNIECIDAMKSAFGANELAVYCKIVAFKYIWRCALKNGSEDVKKAIWYLNKYLEILEGETANEAD